MNGNPFSFPEVVIRDFYVKCFHLRRWAKLFSLKETLLIWDVVLTGKTWYKKCLKPWVYRYVEILINPNLSWGGRGVEGFLNWMAELPKEDSTAGSAFYLPIPIAEQNWGNGRSLKWKGLLKTSVGVCKDMVEIRTFDASLRLSPVTY